MSATAKARHKSKRRLSIYSAADDKMLLGSKLGFAASEAYKLLRTNLVFALPDEQKCRVIGITSSVRGEGKSTTTLNLGYTLAETDKKVLIIEADMRLPTISKRLGLQNAEGLSDLLAGISYGSDVMQESGLHPELKVITAGSIPPNPSELLASERMKKTLEVLSEEFDFILLDLPPVTAVSDPLVVAPLVSGMIVVVCQDYTNRRALDETVRQIEFSNAKLLGFVMNRSNVQEKSRKHYGKKYGYSGKYRGYGYSGSHQKTGRDKTDGRP